MYRQTEVITYLLPLIFQDFPRAQNFRKMGQGLSGLFEEAWEPSFIKNRFKTFGGILLMYRQTEVITYLPDGGDKCK